MIRVQKSILNSTCCFTLPSSKLVYFKYLPEGQARSEMNSHNWHFESIFTCLVLYHSLLCYFYLTELSSVLDMF